jgi:hypothetical protein
MRTFFAFGVALTLLAILIGACRPGTSEPELPYERFRPALKPEYQHYLDDLGPVPVYEIEIAYDQEDAQLTGTAVVQVPNNSEETWDVILFRLYPMLEHYGGNMVILNVAVDGQPASFEYTAENTAIQIDLARTLKPAQTAVVDLSWRLDIPTWADIPTLYALFGKSQEMTSLPLFYPSLSVYVPGPVLGTGEWWKEMGTVRGDAAFNEVSLFVVTATLPSDLVPVTSGTLITSTIISDSLASHVWVTGPSREFVLHMSPDFESATTESYGTRITSYWLPGDESAGRAALRHATSSLRIYSDQYGPYPYRDMRVAPAPITYRGMEYPQVILLGVELYGRFRDKLELIAVHEMAHQWWYQLVHNDPINAPWLDEAIAEYSMKLYMDALRGEDDADQLQYERWEFPVDSLVDDGGDAAVGLTVTSYEDGTQYETIVYGKGALFYDAIRDEIGDRRFKEFLQDYLAEHRYDIVTVEDWQAALGELGSPILVNLYEDWINNPPLDKHSPEAEPDGVPEGE